jgi:hypothetical protein
VHVCIYYIFIEVDLQRWFFLTSGFYVKPYFPVKDGVSRLAEVDLDDFKI